MFLLYGRLLGTFHFPGVFPSLIPHSAIAGIVGHVMTHNVRPAAAVVAVLPLPLGCHCDAATASGSASVSKSRCGLGVAGGTRDWYVGCLFPHPAVHGCIKYAYDHMAMKCGGSTECPWYANACVLPGATWRTQHQPAYRGTQLTIPARALPH